MIDRRLAHATAAIALCGCAAKPAPPLQGSEAVAYTLDAGTIVSDATPDADPPDASPPYPIVSHQHTLPTHRFDNAKRWAKRWDAKSRDEWQQPELVIQSMKLPEAAVVADIGAGTGYFSDRLRTSAARVYAVDIEPDLLKHMQRRFKDTNVEVVKGTATDPKLPNHVDVILIVDTYHHIDKRVEYLRTLASYLKPGGAVVVVDFFVREQQMGPALKYRLPAATVADEFAQTGLFRGPTFTELPYQYVLRFERKP